MTLAHGYNRLPVLPAHAGLQAVAPEKVVEPLALNGEQQAVMLAASPALDEVYQKPDSCVSGWLPDDHAAYPGGSVSITPLYVGPQTASFTGQWRLFIANRVTRQPYQTVMIAGSRTDGTRQYAFSYLDEDGKVGDYASAADNEALTSVIGYFVQAAQDGKVEDKRRPSPIARVANVAKRVVRKLVEPV